MEQVKCLYGGHKCKLCRNDKCNICFNKSFASHKKSKFLADGQIDARHIPISSHNKLIFICNDRKCNHKFEARVRHVVSSKTLGCSYCSNNKLCDDINCEICKEKSFASCEKSKFFSEENGVDPRKIFKKSSEKYIFVCNDNKCNHKFEAPIWCVTKSQTLGCPYCSNKKLCDCIDCDFCLQKSFASHEKSKLWSNKNEQNPRQIFLKSNFLCLFDCDVCGHEFKSRASDIALGGCCGFCQHRCLCNDRTCAFCFDKSFASHEKSKYWSNKNKKESRDVFKNSNSKFLFDCNECGHEICAALCTIIEGSWCSYCNGAALCFDKNVNIVTINLLLLMKKQNIGQKKTKKDLNNLAKVHQRE